MRAQRLTEAHLADVALIERRVFDEPWSEESLKLFCTEDAIGAVCVADGHAVAYGGMLWALDEGQITNIAVLDAYRMRGMGSAILRFLIEEAKKRGCVQISLEVRRSNDTAITLYKKHGFFIAGYRKNFYKHPGEDAAVMLLDLN